MSATSPSVVRIEGARRSPASGIAWSEDLVVTAAHAIRARDGIRVTANDATHDATLVGGDAASDIALLRIDKKALQPIRWSDRGPRTGDIVVSAGRPGRSVRAAFGMISVAAGEAIEVDGVLPRGFSGGPLLSGDGAFGMNTSGVKPGGTTIPRTALQKIVDELLRSGTVRHPLIGIGVYPVEDGLLVMSSQRDELLVGDIVRKIDGKDVRSPRELNAVVQRLEVGREVDVEITRGGEPRTVRIEVRSR